MVVQFGPFRPEKDIENHNLAVFFAPSSGTLEPDWAVAPALLVKTEVVFSSVEISRDTYLACDEKCTDILQQVEDSSSTLINHAKL